MTRRLAIGLTLSVVVLGHATAADAARVVGQSGPIRREPIDLDFCESSDEHGPTWNGSFLVDGEEVTLVFTARNFGPPPGGQVARAGTVWLQHVLDNVSVLDWATYLSFFADSVSCFTCEPDSGGGHLRWDLIAPGAFTYLETFDQPQLPAGWDPASVYLHTDPKPENQSATEDLSDSTQCIGVHNGFALGLGGLQDADTVSTWVTVDGLTPGEMYALSYWWKAVPDSAGNDDLWVTVYGTDPWEAVTGTPLDAAGSTTWSAAWGDYDNDGDPDVYLARGVGSVPGNQLLRNDGAGQFTDVTPVALADAGDAAAATWVDVDNDGRLDLFLANWDASGNKIWQNVGGGSFALQTSLSPGTTSIAAAWADYDGDGDPDLYLTRSAAMNHLYRNDGSFSFVDVTTPPLDGLTFSQGAAWADHDEDGDPDLYVVHYGAPNQLLRNDGGTFVDVATGPLAVLADAGNGRGCAWGDSDNDGDLDLFVANDGGDNRLFENVGSGAAFLQVETGDLKSASAASGASWGDVDNDGDLDLFLSRNLSPNSLFRNDGGNAFVETVGGPFPLSENRNAVGGVFADQDGDGDLDLLVTNVDGEADQLFRNDHTSGNHWLQVDLVGTVSNRFGLGARIELTAGNAFQVREVSSEPSYYSQSSVTAELGLGAATGVDALTIRWPSGIVQPVTVSSVDQRITVVESDVTAAPAVESVPAVFRLLPAVPNPFDRSTRIEFDLPAEGSVRLDIHDVAGRRVRRLADGPFPPGRHRAAWDGRDAAGRPVAAGIYFVRLQAGDRVATRKVAVLGRR